MATLGESIRAARLATGLSLSGLSSESGIDKAHLSEYENDHVVPSLRTLCTLAATLDVPVSRLIEGTCK